MSKFDVQRAWDRAINSLDHLGIQRDVFDAIETIKALEARIAKLEAVRKTGSAWYQRRGAKGQLGSAAETYALRDAFGAALAACDDGEVTMAAGHWGDPLECPQCGERDGQHAFTCEAKEGHDHDAADKAVW